MGKLIGIIGFAVIAALAAPVGAQTGAAVVTKEPGKVGVAETVKVTATITAIDAATRAVTLKGPKGNEMVVTAGPEVKNLAQLKVGDQVVGAIGVSGVTAQQDGQIAKAGVDTVN